MERYKNVFSETINLDTILVENTGLFQKSMFVQSSETTAKYLELYNESFQRRLKCGKLLFLQDLKEMSIADNKLSKRQKRMLSNAFVLMIKFIGKREDLLSSISLQDWEAFGLDVEIAFYLGNLAYLYDGAYPADYRSSVQFSLDGSEDGFGDVDGDGKGGGALYSDMNEAFRLAIRRRGALYLDELLAVALVDHELQDDAPLLCKAFADMKLFIDHNGDCGTLPCSAQSHSPNRRDSSKTHAAVVSSPATDSSAVVDLETVDLRDWLQFGLKSDMVYRLGYLALQLHSEYKSYLDM